MKKSLFAFLVLCASSAHADIIRCTFTEPFATMTYSMAQQRLTIQRPEGTTSYRNVAFQILGPGSFIIGRVDRPRLRLTLDHRGSDGMSDFVYPYTAERPNVFGPGRSQFGGCESNYLRKHSP